MPTLIMIFVMFPAVLLSQLSIKSLSETQKNIDGTCTSIIDQWTSEDLQQATIQVTSSFSELRFSFYGLPFKFDKNVFEDNQEKYYYSRGGEVVILNLEKGLASYWDGTTEKNLSKRFIHYHFK